MRIIALKIQVLEHSLSSSAKAHNPIYEIQSQYFIYPDEKSVEWIPIILNQPL